MESPITSRALSRRILPETPDVREVTLLVRAFAAFTHLKKERGLPVRWDAPLVALGIELRSPAGMQEIEVSVGGTDAQTPPTGFIVSCP